MIRTLAVAALVLFGVRTLDLARLEIGQKGQLPKQSERFFFQVDRILKSDEMLVLPITVMGKLNKQGIEAAPFKQVKGKKMIITGVPTEKLADDSKVLLPGVFLVESTKKVSTATYFVLKKMP
jgi:hypothetical protein